MFRFCRICINKNKCLFYGSNISYINALSGSKEIKHHLLYLNFDEKLSSTIINSVVNRLLKFQKNKKSINKVS